MELDTWVLSPAWGWEWGGWCVAAGDEEAGRAPGAFQADGGREGKLRHGSIRAQVVLDSIPSPTASHHKQHPITSSIPLPMASHHQQPHPPFPEGHSGSAAVLPLLHVLLFALSLALSINLGVIYGDVLFIFFSLFHQAGLEGPHLFIAQ